MEGCPSKSVDSIDIWGLLSPGECYRLVHCAELVMVSRLVIDPQQPTQVRCAVARRIGNDRHRRAVASEQLTRQTGLAHHRRRQRLEPPGAYRAVVVFDVEVNVRMRIDPLDLRDHSTQSELLAGVEVPRDRMMR